MASPNSETGKATVSGGPNRDLITSDLSFDSTEENPQLYGNNSTDSAASASSSALYADSEEGSCDECCGDSDDLVKAPVLDDHGLNRNTAVLRSLSASKGERGALSNRGGLDTSSDSILQMVDSLDTEWTDEKHSSYLDSIEASFVKKMYDREYCALDLCGQAPRQVEAFDSDSAESRLKFPSPFNEFKVWRDGCWQKPTFNRLQRVAVPEVMGSAWIQRFRAPASSEQQAGTLRAVNESCSNCEQKRGTQLKQCLGQTGTVCNEVPDMERALRVWYRRLQSNNSGSNILCGKKEPYNMYARKPCIPTGAVAGAAAYVQSDADWNLEDEAKVEKIHGKLLKKQKLSFEGPCSSSKDQVVPFIRSVGAEEVEDCNYHLKVAHTEQQSNDLADLLPTKNITKHKQLTGNGGDSIRVDF